MKLRTALVVLLLFITCVSAASKKIPRIPKRKPVLPKPSPAEGGCDPSLLSGLSDEDKAILRGVKDGTHPPSAIIPYLQNISSTCLFHFKFDEGTCSVDEAVKAVCDASGTKQMSVLRLFDQCIDKDDACEALQRLKDEECLDELTFGAVSTKMIILECPVEELDVDDLFMVPPEVLRRFIASLTPDEILELAYNLTSSGGVEDLTCEQIQLVIRTLNLNSDSYSQEDFIMMSDLLPYLPSAKCAMLDASLIWDNIDEISDLDVSCGSLEDDKRPPPGKGLMKGKDKDSDEEMDNRLCPKECGRGLVRSLLRSRGDLGLTADDIERLGNLRSCLPSTVITESLKPGQCQSLDAASMPTSSRAVRKMADRCRPQTPPNEWTIDEVISMGCTIEGLKKKEAEEIDDSVLCNPDFLSHAEGCLDDKKARHLRSLIAQKCSSQAASTQRRPAWTLLLGPQGSLQEMDDDDITEDLVEEVLDEIQDMEADDLPGLKAKAFILMEKMKDRKFKDLSKIKGVVKQMSSKEFRDKIGLNPRRELGLDDALPIDLDKKQKYMSAPLLFGDKSTDEILPENLENIGDLVEGLTAEELKLLNPEHRAEMLAVLSKYGGYVGQQVRSLHQMLKEMLKDRNEQNPYKELTEEDVEPMAPRTLLEMDDEQLKEMPNHVCRRVCRKLAHASKMACFVPVPRLQRLAKMCQKCMDQEGNEELDEVDVEAMGELLPYAGEEVLDQISDELLKRIAKRVFRRFHCLPKDLITRLRDRLQDLNVTNEDVRSLGFWVSLLPDEKKEALKEAIAEILNEINEALEDGDEEERENGWCCRRRKEEGEDDDGEGDGEGKDEGEEMEEDIEEALLELAEDTAEETVKRRRRATGSLGCVDIQSIGSALNVIPDYQISAIEGDQFYDCLPTFGKERDWSKDQLRLLLNRVKEVVGDICTLKSGQVLDMGSLVTGMSADELSCLVKDNDVLASLGSFRSWEQDQMAAIIDRFITDPAQMSAMDIANLGYIICGLKPEEIKSILPQVYGSTSAIIGLLDTCPVDRLEALAYLAKQVYGPTEDWDIAIYVDVGIVLGGLSGEDISNTGIEEIEGWQVAGIQHLSASKLEFLSVEHLQSFSREQSLAVSSETRAGLSISKQDALKQAQGIMKPTKGSAGKLASFTVVPLLLMTVLTLIL